MWCADPVVPSTQSIIRRITSVLNERLEERGVCHSMRVSERATRKVSCLSRIVTRHLWRTSRKFFLKIMRTSRRGVGPPMDTPPHKNDRHFFGGGSDYDPFCGGWACCFWCTNDGWEWELCVFFFLVVVGRSVV